jgi:gliding motility-associated-like protein
MRNLATLFYSVLMIMLVSIVLAVGTNNIIKYKTLASSLSGKVVHDKNRDGFLDPSDSGFKNIKVTLNGTSVGGGTITLTTTSDANGNYSFNGLVAGTYNVLFDLPQGSFGLTYSPKNVTGDESNDSDVNTSGISDDVVLDGTTNVANVSAGIVDVTTPKITFVHPLLKNAKSGDTLVFNCESAPQFDANSVTGSDNSTEAPQVTFIDNAITFGNCIQHGFHSLLYCQWIAIDGSGNQSSLHIIVKIVDDKAPTINNVPNDVTVDYSLGQAAPLPNGVSAYDQCYGPVPVALAMDTSFINCVKVINRKWSAIDSCGNAATKTQKVTVLNSGSQNLQIQGIKTKNPSCNAKDGSLLIAAKGTGLQYSIDNGDSYHPSNSFNGLNGGNYKVFVKDANGCKAFESISLTATRCPDTMRLVTIFGSKLDTCITSMILPNNTIGTIQHCDNNNNVSIVQNGNCVSITPKPGFVGIENFCVKQCNTSNPNDCSDIVIVIDVLPRRNVCNNGIITDTAITIFTGDCNAKVTHCFASNSANFILNYDAYINNIKVDSNALEGCNYDSLCYYYSSTITSLGAPPYKLVKWDVNGTNFRLSSFNNISTLIAYMNTVDPTGGWISDPLAFNRIIKSGHNSNVYGVMKVVRIADLSEAELTLDCQATPYGMKLCFYKGVSQVVFVEKNTGCADSVMVTVTCPSPKPPNAVNDYYTTVKNVSITFNVLNNDIFNGTINPVFVPLGFEFKHGRVGFPTGTPAGTLEYVPNKDYCGNDTLCYILCYPNLLCDTACVYVTVNPDLSKLPIAVVDGVKTNKNTTVSIDVLANDTINGTLSSIVITEQGTRGNAVVNGNKIDYVPVIDFCGVDSFIYKICNPNGCDTAKVFVTIECPIVINKLPIAIYDTVSFNKNGSKQVNVLLNDTINGNLDTIRIIKPGRKTVSVVIPSTKNINVLARKDSCGLDTIVYEICNPFGCDTAAIYVNIICPPPVKPIAVDDSVSTLKNTAVLIKVLDNDSPNTSTKSVTILQGGNAKNGNPVVNTNTKNIVYTPNPGFCALDTFYYVLCNTDGLCDTARVIVNVLAPILPKPPIAVDDKFSTNKGVIVSMNVLNNDNTNGALFGPVRIILPNPKHGTALVNNQNVILYTPAADFCGVDTLTYEICNNDGCDTALVCIVVNCPAPKGPRLGDDYITVQKDSSITFNVCINDTLIGLNYGRILDTTKLAKNGTIGFPSDTNDLCNLTYKPNLGFCGKDTFRYVICSKPDLICDTATVYVTVVCPTLKVPVATDDKIDMDCKSGKKIINVLANDNLFGETPTVTLIKAGTKGITTVNANNVEYTPNSTYAGLDTIIYKVCTVGGCDTGYIFLNIICNPIVCIVPVALNDNATTKQGVTVNIAITANDTSNCPIDSIRITNKPKNGDAIVSGNTINYIPNASFCGKDTFQYKVCNAIGCDTAFVFVDVKCDTCKAPVAVNDSAKTTQSVAIVISVIANDSSNCPIDSLRITSNPSNGVLSPAGNSFSYLPNPGFCGRDTFRYKICNVAGCDTALVFVDVKCDSCVKPIAIDDRANTTQSGGAMMIKVLDNDSSKCTIDTVIITAIPKHGIAIANKTGVIYKVDSTFCGKDTFQYSICNSVGCDTAYVFVNIGCDSLPIAVDNADTVLQNGSILIDILKNDTINGKLICFNLIGTPSNGNAFIVKPTNKLNYIPNKDFCGKDSVQYEICNENGKDTAWVRIFVRCEKLTIYNAVSPNGDTKNDHFIITGIEDFPNSHVIIYNRWGERVYETTGYDNLSNNFDGSWDGKKLPDGTYFYCVQDGKGQTYTGYLQLLR